MSERLYDSLRGRAVRALPEEKVRQGLADWLVASVGVPARLLSLEYSLSNLDPRSRKRADLVAWRPDVHGKGGVMPWLLAECKAPDVVLTEKVADQVRGYAGRIRAEYVLITNGSDTRCFALIEGAYARIPGLPAYPSPSRA